MQRLQLKFVQDRTVASVFVGLNPSEPDDRVKAIVAMVGGSYAHLNFCCAVILQVSPSKPSVHYDGHDILLCLTVAMPSITGLLT